MVRKRILAVLATAGTALGLVVGVTMPVSHADTMDNIRASINTTRSNAGCPALTYSTQLEAAAQNLVRTSIDNGAFGGYSGPTTQASTANEGAQDSINRVNVALDARLHDCSWKDFGVGFYRKDSAQLSIVAVYVGKPSAPPPPVCADGTTVPAGQQCPAAPPPPVTCPDGTTVPAGQQCPAPKPVTDAISLSFGPPGLGSITATITNSSDLNGKCTYDATGLKNTHQNFNVPAHGSTPLTFNGFNTGTTYHAVVSCNDASGKQTQPIGTASQDVTF
jgi:hypothetical protein